MPHSPTHEEIHDKTTARHRRKTTPIYTRIRLQWPSVTTLKSIGTSRVTLAASVLTCLALGALASGPAATAAQGDGSVASSTADRSRTDRASRYSDRRSPDQSTKVTAAAPDPSSALATPEQLAKQKADEAARAAEAAKQAAAAKAAADAKKAAEVPTPVAGLTQTQMNNAKAIVQAGEALSLPTRAFVAAVACSLQESRLYNLASSALPESFQYSNEGSGSDHDSVGLFQQRSSTGWGSVKDLMQPSYAATQFYKALTRVPGWQSMALTYAIQAVQVSAFPDAYAQHEAQAQTIVDALTAP
jgi:hypothetical protein